MMKFFEKLKSKKWKIFIFEIWPVKVISAHFSFGKMGRKLQALLEKFGGKFLILKIFWWGQKPGLRLVFDIFCRKASLFDAKFDPVSVYFSL